jgi:hypothetical protein
VTALHINESLDDGEAEADAADFGGPGKSGGMNVFTGWV